MNVRFPENDAWMEHLREWAEEIVAEDLVVAEAIVARDIEYARKCALKIERGDRR